jgi:hypothetical protein
MVKSKKIDEATEMVHQSIIETKGKKNSIKDFDGDVFELTTDMFVGEYKFDQEQKKELAGVAECILRKYSKLLSSTD